ncbi:hypothetical protein [Pedobacter sp. GR22-6]|uniref:hypothetical protein n=1 Tax=Pedobacter sp. GR22-6 TaxID=3127957 RepID=UPI00307D78AD
MSQPLRITYEGKDYSYIILNRPLSKKTFHLRVLLEGEEFELQLDEHNQWKYSGTGNTDNPGLLNAIARTISLRWRL